MENPNWLARCEPQVSLEPLIEEVNKIYHSFDAAQYDGEHPEIYEQLPPIWDEMIAQLPQAGSLNVLNFGCGTGFEANLLLSKLGDRVAKLTAYDPSPEMMAICKTRMQKYPQAVSCSRIEEAQQHGPFNLLITNSLLHHLPNIAGTIASLLPILTPDAIWLAGHEPSARFYRNDSCLKLLEEYRLHRTFAKWFQVGNYTTKFRLIVGRHPLSATAHVAFKRGLFLKLPSAAVINKIVDFHVAHSIDEVNEGRGLDIEKMQSSFQRDWILQWSKTYSFLGSYPYASVTNGWEKKARLLEKQFPQDGANFSMVWHSKPGSVTAPVVESKGSI